MPWPTKKLEDENKISLWDYVSRSLMALEIISIITGLYFIWVQLKNIVDNQKLSFDQASTEQNIREIQFLKDFKKELTTGVNYQIYTSLVHGKPILRENGGTFTTDDLKEYLSVFNELSFVSGKGFIDGSVIWSFFYYYIAYTFENKEIQTYLKLLREYSPGRFGGLDRLYNYIKEYQVHVESLKGNEN